MSGSMNPSGFCRIVSWGGNWSFIGDEIFNSQRKKLDIKERRVEGGSLMWSWLLMKSFKLFFLYISDSRDSGAGPTKREYIVRLKSHFQPKVVRTRFLVFVAFQSIGRRCVLNHYLSRFPIRFYCFIWEHCFLKLLSIFTLRQFLYYEIARCLNCLISWVINSIYSCLHYFFDNVNLQYVRFVSRR